MSVQLHNREGIVCGKRTDGSRCVLWQDDVFEWFNAGQFASLFETGN
jgi:hypothetical protein